MRWWNVPVAVYTRMMPRIRRLAAAGALALTSAGCGFAAGHFQGNSSAGYGSTVMTQGYSAQTTHGTGENAVTTTDYSGEFTVGSGMGAGIGTLDGIATTSMKNGKKSASETTPHLHVYFDLLYHPTSSFAFSIDSGIDWTQFDHLNTDLGLRTNDLGYRAIDLLARPIYAPATWFELYAGGGYTFGHVDTLDAGAWRLVAGVQPRLFKVGVPVLLRIEGAYTLPGQNSFSQKSLTGGLIFWFPPG